MLGAATKAMRAHRRGAATTQIAPRRHNPWAQGGCGRMRRCSSATMLLHCLPPRALPAPRKPPARDPPHYSDRLLARRRLNAMPGSCGTNRFAPRCVCWGRDRDGSGGKGMRQARAALLAAIAAMLLCGIATAADVATPTSPASQAAATTRLDVEAATAGYMARLSPEAKAKSDAYFEGGYWLILWDFVVGLVV